MAFSAVIAAIIIFVAKVPKKDCIVTIQSLIISYNRKLKPECASYSFLAYHTELCIMKLKNILYNRQSKTCADNSSFVNLIYLVVSVPDIFDIFFSNTLTTVLYFNAYMLVFSYLFNNYAAVFR